MTYSASAPKDITEGIPLALSHAAQASSQVFTSKGIPYDVAIGGIAFIMAATDANSYQRETAPFQKNQVDTSKEAGEQTLDGYWIRSQTTWHRGAGIRFYEPGTANPGLSVGVSDTEFRFEESLGVDVWTKDQATLLKSCAAAVTVTTGQEVRVHGAVVGGADVLFTNENGTVRRRDASGSTLATYTPTGAIPTGRLAVGGNKFFTGCTSFGIDYGTTTGSVLTRLYNQSLASTPVPYWVKSRIIASRDNLLFELAPDGTTNGGTLDGLTPLYTHPDALWTWSGVTEGPAAIYAAGYSSGSSAIYRFGLQDAGTGSVPVLSQAYQVAELPFGEEVYSIKATLGRYIGVGTSKGLRVAMISDNGDLDMGPLLFTTTNPIRCITSYDRFIYAGVEAAHPDGFSGAVRVDLGEMIGGNTLYNIRSLRFPYAWDARRGAAGRLDAITTVGKSDRIAFAVLGDGIYMQSATLYEVSGWIRSGRIRYNTVEQKLFRNLAIGATLSTGSLSVYSVDDAGNELYLRTISASTDSGGVISLSGQIGTYEFLRFKTLLTSSTDHLSTPTLNSVQVRALPANTRQRLIQYPLLCMDLELAANGQKTGYEGFAAARVKGIEAVEATGLVVLVQDFLMDETYEGSIEKISFKRPGPRSTDQRKNFGGFIDIVVRRL